MAGGKWQVINEKFDLRVVKQEDNLSCGAACGEMLLKEKGINNINQSMIAQRGGIPVDVATLANVLNFFTTNLNGEWQGRGFIYGASYIDTVNWLTNRGIWAGELRELGKGIGHLIIIDGCDSQEKMLIRDPWHGTSYKMEKTEFINYWTLRGVRWIQK
ncbi:MAG TPA: papain-like cysteine protease family protein [Allocoleopsis sp.]